MLLVPDAFRGQEDAPSELLQKFKDAHPGLLFAPAAVYLYPEEDYGAGTWLHESGYLRMDAALQRCRCTEWRKR